MCTVAEKIMNPWILKYNKRKQRVNLIPTEDSDMPQSLPSR